MDYGYVSTALQELHHFFTFACQLRPAGLCFWILLQGADGFALKLEIDLGEFALCGAADGVRIATDGDAIRGFDECLLPNGNDACLKLWRAQIDGHAGILARLADLFDPAVEDVVVGAFDVDEFDAHADARLENAHDGEGFDLLPFARQRDTHAGGYRERLTGADEAAAERDVGGDADGAASGLHVDEFGVGSEGKANRVATVAHPSPSRLASGDSFVHIDHVAEAHCSSMLLRRALTGRNDCALTARLVWRARSELTDKQALATLVANNFAT